MSKRDRREYLKEYEAKNKEKLKAYRKAYREANREKRRLYDKAYKARNKERYKAYREARKLPYTIIYCIPNYNGKNDNYVGITNQIEARMGNHKHLGKLNTEEYIELDRVDTRAEAEVLEAQYHERGYHGINNRNKNTNN